MKFLFAYPIYLQSIRVKVVYEGYRVEVKVTGAQNVENSYSRNVQLPPAITPVLYNLQPQSLQHGFLYYDGSNGVTAILSRDRK